MSYSINLEVFRILIVSAQNFHLECNFLITKVLKSFSEHLEPLIHPTLNSLIAQWGSYKPFNFIFYLIFGALDEYSSGYYANDVHYVMALNSLMIVCDEPWENLLIKWQLCKYSERTLEREKLSESTSTLQFPSRSDTFAFIVFDSQLNFLSFFSLRSNWS